MTAKKKSVYKVVFNNEGKTYEIYAKSISQGDLFGFVEIEGLLFGEKSSIVVDPAEESLQREFAGVVRTYIPLHSIVRIDAVEKRGASKIHPLAEAAGKVTMLPTPVLSGTKTDT